MTKVEQQKLFSTFKSYVQTLSDLGNENRTNIYSRVHTQF